MVEILDKTKEWSDRFGGILRASAQTQFPWLYKGAVGGLQHVISVDNAGAYMELWRSGENDGNYYATTGAAIKPLPGLAKGARLDEALDRFFTLMAKVEKDKAAMKRRLNMHQTGVKHSHAVGQNPNIGVSTGRVLAPGEGEGGRVASPAKKAIPKKLKRLLGLKKNGEQSDWYDTSKLNPGRPRPKPVKKNIVEKVDPEIGPSHSVGHRKPSDLSPESGISKLAKRVIKQMTEEERFRRGGAPSKPIQPMHPGQRMGGGPESIQPLAPHPGLPAPKNKNVVALTGNQPGSGRVKVTDPTRPTKPGTPPKTYNSPQGFSGRRMGAPGTPGAPAGTSGGRPAGARKARKGANLGQKTSQRRTPYVGGRPAGMGPGLGKGRKIDDLEGGRVGAGGKITPVKPAMGGPGQPSSYGSTGQPQYNYKGYRQPQTGKVFNRACNCTAAEVAKAMKAVRKGQRPPKKPRTDLRSPLEGSELITPKPGRKPPVSVGRR